jgi:hypothetical protein
MEIRLRKYLVAWALCLLLALSIIVYIPAYAAECLVVYMMTTWVAAIGILLSEGEKIGRYLRENHPYKWLAITRSPGRRDGGRNVLLGFGFLWSRDDLGDPTLCRLKSGGRRLLLLMCAVFLHYIVLGGFLSF